MQVGLRGTSVLMLALLLLGLMMACGETCENHFDKGLKLYQRGQLD